MTNSKQNVKTSSRIDFDEWADLANNNPDEFEQRRQNCIEQFIDGVPISRQRRLRGLQFRIDMERKKARTPLGACIKLSSMMWDAVTGDNGLVSTVKLLVEPNLSAVPISKPMQRATAKIIYFNKNKFRH